MKGQSNLNLIFIAHLFNECPGLTPTKDEMDAAGIVDDDTDQEASKEERVFRMWINSLGLEDVYINDLV